MDAKTREALEAAHHELTTLHGLRAYDAEAPEETFQIDALKALAKIDAALSGDTGTVLTVSSGPRCPQTAEIVPGTCTKGETIQCLRPAGHDGDHAWAANPWQSDTD